MRQLVRTLSLLLFVSAGFLCPAAALAADDNLNMVFTTTNAGGVYGTRHVHVVWLTTESGQWVCTVGNDAANKRALWANARAYSLSTWYKSNPKPKDDVDARTGATPTAYSTYSINWNWRKLDKTVVPDGTYKLHFECTNDDDGNPRNYAVFTITKGRSNWSLGPTTQGGYRDVKLTYTVAGLSLENASVSELTEVSAVVGGSLAGTNGKPHRLYVYWGDNDGAANPGDWDYRADLGQVLDGSFTTELTGLTKGQTYFYRCHVVGESESLWARDTRQFKTEVSPIIFAEGDIWTYFEGYSYPGDGWNDVGFAAGADWKTGPAGIGFGDGDDATVLDMVNRYTTVYMRYRFDIPAPADITGMKFKVDYDDGFVAYLNGREVMRRGVPEGQDERTTAQNHAASVEGGQIETLDLGAYIGDLRAGGNVFAIEVHNAETRSSDLTMIPELTVFGLRSPQPDLVPAVRELHFGNVEPGAAAELTLGLANRGQEPVRIKSLRIVGLMPEAFTVESSRPLPLDLEPGVEETLLVRFSPTAAQTYAYTRLMIGSTDWDEPLISISLSGGGGQTP
ncbi:MAG: DUF2271 domain-containing protein [Planctomycetes bacterium]|nr:DUF2271 domain-containing protein [Planctomycetota bacterium]